MRWRDCEEALLHRSTWRGGRMIGVSLCMWNFWDKANAFLGYVYFAQEVPSWSWIDCL